MTALKEMYRTEIVPKLQTELGLKNVMAVPRISKITLNMGVGEAVGRQESPGARCLRYGKNCRSKARDHQISQVDCWLQDSGWLADRMQSDAA